MAAHVRTVVVPEADRRQLQRRVRAKGALAREVERARSVLLAADGVAGKRIAAIIGCAEPTVVTWRGRYAERGLAGLVDEPRPGKPSPLPEALRNRVLELTLTVPPTEHGVPHWSSRLLAERLAAEGSPIWHASIAWIWHRFGVPPWRTQTFKFSTDPELEAKIRDDQWGTPHSRWPPARSPTPALTGIATRSSAPLCAYLTGAGHGFLDREFSLPVCWTDDPSRCTAAGVPDNVIVATKPALAGALLARALPAGGRIRWFVGDEVYGHHRARRIQARQP